MHDTVGFCVKFPGYVFDGERIESGNKLAGALKKRFHIGVFDLIFTLDL